MLHVTARLPERNRWMLRVLGKHLATVSANSDRNKMTIGNLGLLFCPTLGIGSMLFGLWIRHWNTLFPVHWPENVLGNVKKRSADVVQGSGTLGRKELGGRQSPAQTLIDSSWLSIQGDIMSMPADVGTMVKGLDLMATLETHFGPHLLLENIEEKRSSQVSLASKLSKTTNSSEPNQKRPSLDYHRRSNEPTIQLIDDQRRHSSGGMANNNDGAKGPHSTLINERVQRYQGKLMDPRRVVIPIELEREARRYQRRRSHQPTKSDFRVEENTEMSVAFGETEATSEDVGQLLGFDYTDELTGVQATGVLNLNPRRRPQGEAAAGRDVYQLASRFDSKT